MPCQFEVTRRVEFSDTDMAGIMHFSNFFRFMETAEHAFFRSLGHSVLLSRSGFELHLPRVHAECDYFAPLHFEDEVLIRLLVQEKGTRAITYQFRFYRVRGARRDEVARGRLVVVCAGRGPDGTLKAVSLPRAIADRIQAAPAALLDNSAEGKARSRPDSSHSVRARTRRPAAAIGRSRTPRQNQFLNAPSN